MIKAAIEDIKKTAGDFNIEALNDFDKYQLGMLIQSNIDPEKNLFMILAENMRGDSTISKYGTKERIHNLISQDLQLPLHIFNI